MFGKGPIPSIHLIGLRASPRRVFGISNPLEGFKLFARRDFEEACTRDASECMCWNIRISLVAACWGYGVSVYLHRRQPSLCICTAPYASAQHHSYARRQYSARDRWYAAFLATFTTTQARMLAVVETRWCIRIYVTPAALSTYAAIAADGRVLLDLERRRRRYPLH